MPTLRRAPNARELQELEKIFLEAEQRIVDEIGRLQHLGLVDYHAVAALKRVQRILKDMNAKAGKYVPLMVKKMFYVYNPELRKTVEYPETVAKHLNAYLNAEKLTGTQSEVVRLLVNNLMGEIDEASATVMAKLSEALLGRQEPDIFRTVGLRAAASMQAVGKGVSKTIPEFVRALQQEGVPAFVDKAGRTWNLHSYANMVCRTTSRQAQVAAVLTADEEQDLYKISKHKTTCGLCAPYEGRVYSKSGLDPDFPPLADAFGKVDPLGGNILANTYLNIHPNCLHAIIPWTPAGRTPEEIQKIKDFSSPEKRPYSVDPRTKKQIEAYRKKERARRKLLADTQQWERYAASGIGPKTFETFQKHKAAGDEKYKQWQREYRRAMKQEREERET